MLDLDALEHREAELATEVVAVLEEIDDLSRRAPIMGADLEDRIDDVVRGMADYHRRCDWKGLANALRDPTASAGKLASALRDAERWSGALSIFAAIDPGALKRYLLEVASSDDTKAGPALDDRPAILGALWQRLRARQEELAAIFRRRYRDRRTPPPSPRALPSALLFELE